MATNKKKSPTKKTQVKPTTKKVASKTVKKPTKQVKEMAKPQVKEEVKAETTMEPKVEAPVENASVNTPEPQGEKKKKKFLIPLICILGVAALAGAGVGIYFAVRGGNPEPDPTVYHTLKFEGTRCEMHDESGKPVIQKAFEAGQTASYHLVGESEELEIPKNENVKLTITGTKNPFDGIFSYNEADGSLSVKMTADITVTATSNPIVPPAPTYSAINKVTITNDGEDYREIDFEYIDEDEYVETIYKTAPSSSNEPVIDHKTYHIIKKTDDNGYIDYSCIAKKSTTSEDFELTNGTINTYNANGKVVSIIGLGSEKDVHLHYPPETFSYNLPSIELSFHGFEKTKFYYTRSIEFSYNDKSLTLNVIPKGYVDDNNTLELALWGFLNENIYDGNLLSTRYECSCYPYTDPNLYRYDYIYDNNGHLTDESYVKLTPNGEGGEFETFLNNYNVNSSFTNYSPGFIEDSTDSYNYKYAYLYNSTDDPDTFEVETFKYDFEQDKYCLFTSAWSGNSGGYSKKTYKENGSYKEVFYSYTPPQEEWKTREELEFINLALDGPNSSEEKVFDEHNNNVKYLVEYKDELGEMQCDSDSFIYTFDGEKIINYIRYEYDSSFEVIPVNIDFEYTNVDYDYKQTHGWIFNNVTEVYNKFNLP